MARNLMNSAQQEHKKDRIHFAILNDIHEDTEKYVDLFHQIDSASLDFMVLNGDMTNNMDRMEQLYNGYLNQTSKLYARSIPFYMVRGNHETRGRMQNNFIEQFPNTTGQPYYTFNSGPVFFVVLDGGEDKPDSDIEYCDLADFDNYRTLEAEWLRGVVNSPEYKNATYRVVLIHIPPVGREWHGLGEIRRKFLPILNKANVDVMFSGHIHRHALYTPGEEGVAFPIVVNSNNEILDVTARQLCDRYDFQKTALAKQFPLLMSRLWNGADTLGPNDTIESVINQGTLGIGFIGLAECLVALIGQHHGESDEAQALGLRIVSHMRSRANEFSERYNHNFSVLATPAEGLAGRFTRRDRKSFGQLSGITDREYYTNSNHVPVYYHCSPRHKAIIEAPYHELTRGGHIFYVEIDGDATHNPEAIADIVDLMDKHNIGYCSVNHNRNRCMSCGYEDASAELTECPKCHSNDIDRLQRITGYLVGTTDRWNSAKLAELNDRVVHQ